MVAKGVELGTEDLRRLNEVKSRFLNMAAHELNTPITPIRLQLHLLQAGALGRLEAEQARAVGIVARNVDRLAALVQEILDVARMEGGGLRLKLEPVPLDQLIGETWESYEEPARRVGIRLLRPASTNAVVHTDRQRMLQILYNLMSNAIKFTPADGEIRMTVNRRRDTVEICVIDSGIGMTAQQIAGLYRPFTRLHEDDSTASGGSGLGLYIAQGLAQQLGGHLAASSPGPGKGATFCLTIPLEPSVAAHIAQPQSAEAEELARRLRQLI
ncbi:MAG: hypothetical protein QOD77_1426 [Thermoplasmata archaeon]|jgi:signal transduction histidine kinase|nr:hypothetical protein [Thermoplasmata archaeon]